MPAFGLALLSYFSGGIPSGYLIARYLKGIDIREHGSGNPGAANVYRVVGKEAGILTLALDALKGFLPVLLAKKYYPEQYGILILCGLLTILGHMWTVFLRFKGGKGVATSAGVFAALLPAPTLAGFGAFLIGVALSRHISVGSMAAAVTMPLSCFLFKSPAPLHAMITAVSILVLVKHIPNLKKLTQGKEFSFKHEPQPQEPAQKP